MITLLKIGDITLIHPFQMVDHAVNYFTNILFLHIHFRTQP